MKNLVERLTRLGLHEAAQIVARYDRLASDLHAERQKNVELQKTVDRLERKDSNPLIHLIFAVSKDEWCPHDGGPHEMEVIEAGFSRCEKCTKYEVR